MASRIILRDELIQGIPDADDLFLSVTGRGIARLWRYNEGYRSFHPELAHDLVAGEDPSCPQV